MKRNYLLFFILINSFYCYSQENTVELDDKNIRYRKNELKVGVIKALSVPVIDIEYERVLNQYTSFGGNTIISLDSDAYFYDFSLSPFFRFYFTETKEYGTKGFFAQPFLSYYTGEDDVNGDGNDQKFNSFGIGFGLGKKWVNKQGFVLQFLVGVARTISGSESAPDAVFQGDLSIGYRF